MFSTHFLGSQILTLTHTPLSNLPRFRVYAVDEDTHIRHFDRDFSLALYGWSCSQRIVHVRSKIGGKFAVESQTTGAADVDVACTAASVTVGSIVLKATGP